MFQIGDKIAHPMHGAGLIEKIVERRVSGISRQYYVVRFSPGSMTVMIPVNACNEIGIRAIITQEEAEQVLNSIPDIPPDTTQNWNRRYRENMIRIKSGDPLEVARVIKGLVERDKERGLSTDERKMLKSAKHILISEIVLSTNSTYDEVEKRLIDAIH